MLNAHQTSLKTLEGSPSFIFFWSKCLQYFLGPQFPQASRHETTAKRSQIYLFFHEISSVLCTLNSSNENTHQQQNWPPPKKKQNAWKQQKTSNNYCTFGEKKQVWAPAWHLQVHSWERIKVPGSLGPVWVGCNQRWAATVFSPKKRRFPGSNSRVVSRFQFWNTMLNFGSRKREFLSKNSEPHLKWITGKPEKDSFQN